MKRKLVFLAVGVFNTLADYAIFMVLTSLAVFGLGLAGMISGTIMMIVSFFLHKNFTWKDRGTDNRAIGLFLLGTGATTWLVRPFMMGLFGLLAPFYIWIASWLTVFSGDFIVRTAVFGLTTLVTLTLNYLWYHFVVFKEKDAKTRERRGDQ